MSLKYHCSVGLLHSIGTLLFSQDKVQALRVIFKAVCNLYPALLSIHIPFLYCRSAKLFVALQKHQRLNYKLTFPTERLNNNFYNSQQLFRSPSFLAVRRYPFGLEMQLKYPLLSEVVLIPL